VDSRSVSTANDTIGGRAAQVHPTLFFLSYPPLWHMTRFLPLILKPHRSVAERSVWSRILSGKLSERSEFLTFPWTNVSRGKFRHRRNQDTRGVSFLGGTASLDTQRRGTTFF